MTKNNTVVMILSFLLLAFPLLSIRAQAPKYETPPFSDISHRTDVCGRFRDFAAGKINISDALEGLELNVGVVDQPNPLYLNLHPENGTINDAAPGLFVVILDELARRGKFTWRESYGRVYKPSSNSSVTWTDVLVDSVFRYDVSFAEWVHTEERRSLGVLFPLGWYDTSTVFVIDSRSGIVNDFQLLRFAKPFTWQLWLLFAFGFIYNRSLYWLLDKIEHDGERREISSKSKVFRIGMVEMVYDSDRSNAKRMFGISASLFAMVYTSSYTAKLATALISQSRPDFEFVSVDDLSSRRVPVCLRENDAVYEKLSKDYADMNILPSTNLLRSFELLLGGDCSVVAARRADFEIYERNETANPDCTLEWVGRPQYINFGGMATKVDMDEKCTSLVMHVLDLHMHEMTDFLDEAWRGYLEARSDYKCRSGKNKKTRYSLTLNDIGGIFFIFAGIAIISIFITMIEQRSKRKRSAQRAQNVEDLRLFEEMDEDGGDGTNAASISIDTDALRRILTIDQEISKLKYEVQRGQRSPLRTSGGSGSKRNLFGLVSESSFIGRRSSGIGDYGTSFDKSTTSSPPRQPAEGLRHRIVKRESQRNILSMG